MAWWDYLMGPVSAGANALSGGAISKGIGNVGSAIAAPVKAAASSTPARTEQLPLYRPEQQQAILQFLQAGMGGLGQLGQLNQQQFRVPSPSIAQLFNQTLGQSQAGFAPIAAEARRQFPQLVNQLSERFTSLGPSAQRSSAFQGALGSAASGLESSLASLGAQFGQNQQSLNQGLLGQLLGSQAQQYGQQNQLFTNLAQLGLISPFQNQFHPRIPSLLENLGTAAAYGVGRAAPTAFGL